jgi:archaellum component FlaD/FlaE
MSSEQLLPYQSEERKEETDSSSVSLKEETATTVETAESNTAEEEAEKKEGKRKERINRKRGSKKPSTDIMGIKEEEKRARLFHVYIDFAA